MDFEDSEQGIRATEREDGAGVGLSGKVVTACGARGERAGLQHLWED